MASITRRNKYRETDGEAVRMDFKRPSSMAVDELEDIKGVFSSSHTLKIGIGTTARKQASRLLWYVEKTGADQYSVRKLNHSFVPVGEEEFIDKETLLNEYTPEVEVYNSQVKPAVAELNKTIKRGDKNRAEGNLLSAEMEYSNALEVDEKNVRATFGLGLVYLERQDEEKSNLVFDELVGMQAAFAKKHKHLFNEFGIALRKSKLYDHSIRYYRRAAELTENDENLYSNLARAYFEKGEWDQCLHAASLVLELDSKHDYILSMCKYVVGLSKNYDKVMNLGLPPVSPESAERAKELLGNWKPSKRSGGGGQASSEMTDLDMSFEI